VYVLLLIIQAQANLVWFPGNQTYSGSWHTVLWRVPGACNSD